MGTRNNPGAYDCWDAALDDEPRMALLGRDPVAPLVIRDWADTFHEKVPDEWIDKCFAVMALTPHHIHQVLTKRPERMREYMRGVGNRHVGDKLNLIWRKNQITDHMYDIAGFDEGTAGLRWPLPNVWLGTSVEDQKRADERIPILLDTPAAVRWLSMEPLLGPVNLKNLRQYNPRGLPWINALTGIVTRGDYLPRSPDECGFNVGFRVPGELPKLDWIVVGGESGPNARPMHPDWARSIRDQCAAAGVPFHFKQFGDWAPSSDEVLGDMAHVHAFPDGLRVGRFGKKMAGRQLDGVEHNGFPERVAANG